MTADQTRQGCPALEEIAALLDGRAERHRRGELIEHLATCAACYEIFAGSARFLVDEAARAGEGRLAEVVRLPAARTSWGGRWAAASGLVAALLAVLVLSSPLVERWRQPPTPARLAAALTAGLEPVGALDHGWNYTRGPRAAAAEPRRAFRLGVLMVDLQALLDRNQPSAAAASLPEAARLIAGVGVAGPALADYLRELEGRLKAASHPPVPRGEASRASSYVAGGLPDGELPYFRLGAWCEAGRLAAAAGDRRYFGRAIARHPPTALGTLAAPPALGRSLAALERALAGSPRSAALSDLARRFEAAVQAGGESSPSL
jgi:hypothetical protein